MNLIYICLEIILLTLPDGTKPIFEPMFKGNAQDIYLWYEFENF